ncbi:MAG: hypothetical protein JW917_00865 [Ignavibacteria bacterium]|nr:hypothetical protein [Ignavibacteria bacterium]
MSKQVIEKVFFDTKALAKKETVRFFMGTTNKYLSNWTASTALANNQRFILEKIGFQIVGKEILSDVLDIMQQALFSVKVAGMEIRSGVLSEVFCGVINHKVTTVNNFEIENGSAAVFYLNLANLEEIKGGNEIVFEIDFPDTAYDLATLTGSKIRAYMKGLLENNL